MSSGRPLTDGALAGSFPPINWYGVSAVNPASSCFEAASIAFEIVDFPVPLIAYRILSLFSTMERIDVVSNAMELRGFGKKKARTWYSKRPLVAADYAVLAFITLFFVAAMVITYADGSRYFNPFV